MTARRTALLVLLVALLGMPAGASAADGLDVRLAPYAKWPDRQLILSLPGKRVLSNDQVTVTENGQDVLATRVTSEANNRKRGVVLVIDSSLTMRGDPIRQAIIASRSFARRRAENTPMGIIFFSRSPRVALAPTTDPRAIKTTLAVGPALSRGTKIFDAANQGISSLKAAGLTSGAVIVLSDGAEARNGSAITPVQLAAAARDANVRIFSVGLNSRSFNSAALKEMASSTGGRYGEAARPQDLPPLFAAIGERLSSEYTVSYKSPSAAGDRVTVQTVVDGFPGTNEIAYRAPTLSFAGAKAGHANTASGLDTTRIALLVIGGFLVLTLVLFLILRPTQRSVVSRVEDFAPGVATAPPTMADIRAVEEKPERQPSDRWRRFTENVELADIRLSPEAVALWTAFLTVLVAWYLGVAIGRPPLMIMAIAIPFLVRAWIKSRVNRRRMAFEDQLPDNLQVLASALRAGFSFSAALASMAEDAPEPSRAELRRASSDEQLGVDVAESLKAISVRMDSPEVEYVGIVAKMQREVGGNTAEVLDQVIETIRARQQLKRTVRTLTAQGRMGGAVISAMPVVVGFGMAALHPGYFDPMFKSSTGVLLFILGGIMLALGWVAISKIVDVEP